MSHTAIATRPAGIRLSEYIWQKVAELDRYTGSLGDSATIERLLNKYIDAEIEAARNLQPSLFGGNE